MLQIKQTQTYGILRMENQRQSLARSKKGIKIEVLDPTYPKNPYLGWRKRFFCLVFFTIIEQGFVLVVLRVIFQGVEQGHN